MIKGLAYAVTMKHSAISCPIFNEETKKKFREGTVKRDEAAKKNKVKVLLLVLPY